MNLVLIDDEEQIVNALEREIRIGCADEDFEINTFTNPHTALSFIRANGESVFLVICDMRMPGMDGAELLSEIRTGNTDVPFVLLTGYSDIQDIQRAISTSIQSLLLKPWKQVELFAQIRKARDTWMLRRENERLKSELDMQLETAGEFQRLLLSGDLPELDGARVSITNKPFAVARCGGDYFDVIPHGTGDFTVILGDVAGHGIRSAFVTMMLKTILQEIRLTNERLFGDPSKLIIRLNRELYNLLKNNPTMFTAMSVITFSRGTRSALLGNAGQLPVFIISEGKVRPVSSTGMVLGVKLDGVFKSTTLDISPGDRIVMMTDGMCEDIGLRARLENGKIISVLEKIGDLDCKTVHDIFRRSLPRNVFTDDATLIIIDIPLQA